MQNHDNVIPIYRTGRLVTITVVSLVLADIAGAQQQDQSLSDNAHARLLAEGFLANYETFPFYECKMQTALSEILAI